MGGILEDAMFLMNMTFLLLVAGICSVILKKLRMPAIIGYLLAGIILANYWVDDSGDTQTIISILSSMGLVLMMFCIGMELNLKKLKKTGLFAIVVCLIQIPLMVSGGHLFGILMGWGTMQSLLFGAIISGSSTAVVTTVLRDQGKISKEETETIILVTVMEDVAQVLILSMASPMLTGNSLGLDSMVWMILLILVFIVSSVSIGILTIPRALDWIATKMPDEILLITSLGMCFAMALMSVWIGMSMAIGAFLMGVIVSQSNARNTIEHDITPMKDIFMAMFFISIGLEITPLGLVENIILTLIIFAVYTLLKIGSVFIAYFIGNKPLRISFMSAMSLVAMGEFAFIIAKAGFDAGILSQSFYTSVVSAALISMVALPILSRNSGRIYDYISKNSPKPVVNAVKGAAAIRDDRYAKVSLTSKSTSSKFKQKAILVYVTILLLIMIEVVFLFLTPSITNFLFNNIQMGVSYNICYIVVLAVNFVIITLLVENLMRHIKFVQKVLIDAERKAESKGKGNLQRRSIRFYKAFLKINNWLFAFAIAFVVMMLMPVPSDLGVIEHTFAAICGLGVVLLIYAFRHRTNII